MLLGQSHVDIPWAGWIAKGLKCASTEHKAPAIKKQAGFILILIGLVCGFPGSYCRRYDRISELYLLCNNNSYVWLVLFFVKLIQGQRKFKTPWVPFIPILGIVVCGAMVCRFRLDQLVKIICLRLFIGFGYLFWMQPRNSVLQNKKCCEPEIRPLKPKLAKT